MKLLHCSLGQTRKIWSYGTFNNNNNCMQEIFWVWYSGDSGKLRAWFRWAAPSDHYQLINPLCWSCVTVGSTLQPAATDSLKLSTKQQHTCKRVQTCSCEAFKGVEKLGISINPSLLTYDTPKKRVMSVFFLKTGYMSNCHYSNNKFCSLVAKFCNG